MASQYFYQKQMGPRRTPPPRKTSLIEINGAVPDISILSDCLGSIRVNSNDDNSRESNREIVPNTKSTSGGTRLQKPNEANLNEERGHLRPKETYDDHADHFRRIEPTFSDQHSNGNQNFEMRTVRRESPLPPNYSESDFDRECRESYQKWRAKNAELFTRSENADEEINHEIKNTEQVSSQKSVRHSHDYRNDSNYKVGHVRDHLPNESTIDRYYKYFGGDPYPHERFDNGNYDHVKEIPINSENDTRYHQIISSYPVEDPRLQYDPEELNALKYHELCRNTSTKEFPMRNYSQARYIHEGINMKRLDPCHQLHRFEQQRFHLDERFQPNFKDPLTHRLLEKEENLRGYGQRDFIAYSTNDNGDNRLKDSICPKNIVPKNKSKKSPAIDRKYKTRDRPCSCRECGDEDDSKEDHVGLVKYKKNRNFSKFCSETLDESDSSIDCTKHSCKGGRKKKTLSIEDLYKIVKLQNEQIMLLQKQVDRLLEQQNKSPVKQNGKISKRKSLDNKENFGCECEREKTQAQSFKLSVVKENSQLECLQAMEKHNGVSIGVMTSFVEIMQKAQIGQKNVCQKKNGCGDGQGTYSEDDHPDVNSPNSHEIGDKKKKKKSKQALRRSVTTSRKPQREISTMADSFTFNEGELPVVREQTPSPDCSVHIDMQDYDSSSSSSSASSDNESEANANTNSWDTNTDSEELKVGWTLYDNVVGQVNNILHNAPAPNQHHNQVAVPTTEDVRKATMEQLRLLGVNFGDVDQTASKKVTFNQLPTDFNTRNGNTNLSYATLCYLERYNIKPGSANIEKRFEVAENGPIETDIPKPQPRRNYHNYPQQNHYPPSRILDISALKQQSKLL